MRLSTDFFIDVDGIKKWIDLPFHNISIKTSVVAEGFVAFDCEALRDIKEARLLAEGSIVHYKPLFMFNPDARCLSVANEVLATTECVGVIFLNNLFRLIPQGYAFTKSDGGRFKYLGLIPENYLLRRFWSREVLLNLTPAPQPVSLQRQVITCIGLPPTPERLEDHAFAAIRGANHLLLFDRTKENILSHLHLDKAYIVRYDYLDYSANIKEIDRQLLNLARQGIGQVTLLVEGHPEIYDLVECLPQRNREFRVIPTKPLLLFAVEMLEADFGIAILDSGLVLTSGFNARHGLMTSELSSEIECYLATGISVCVMEMFLGDLPLVLRLLESTGANKCAFVLTNMFSPEQSIYFASHNRLSELAWVEAIKGLFTSLVVFDAKLVNGAAQEAIRSKLGERAKM